MVYVQWCIDTDVLWYIDWLLSEYYGIFMYKSFFEIMMVLSAIYSGASLKRLSVHCGLVSGIYGKCQINLYWFTKQNHRACVLKNYTFNALESSSKFF